jgi:hypothetical protein
MCHKGLDRSCIDFSYFLLSVSAQLGLFIHPPFGHIWSYFTASHNVYCSPLHTSFLIGGIAVKGDMFCHLRAISPETESPPSANSAMLTGIYLQGVYNETHILA